MVWGWIIIVSWNRISVRRGVGGWTDNDCVSVVTKGVFLNKTETMPPLSSPLYNIPPWLNKLTCNLNCHSTLTEKISAFIFGNSDGFLD